MILRKLGLGARFKFNNIVGVFALLVVLILFFHYQSEYFLTSSNLVNISNQIVIMGLIAIPMTFIIISGAMDLSIGSILGLAAVTMAYVYHQSGNIVFGILAALAVGLICGSFNGLLIAKYRMQALMVTIGTLVLYRGLVQVITKGRPISGFPDSFYYLSKGLLWGIPVSVILLVVLYVLAWMFLTKTRFGRYGFALGNNEEVVRYSGINVVKIRFYSFVICGLFSSVAGLYYASYFASADANAGRDIELDVITAVLIGGTNIFGGKGSLIGTVFGILIIGVLRNGLNLMGLSVLYQMVLLGVLILIVVGKQKNS